MYSYIYRINAKRNSTEKSVYVYSKIEEAFILFLKILLTFQIYTLPLASLFSGVII